MDVRVAVSQGRTRFSATGSDEPDADSHPHHADPRREQHVCTRFPGSGCVGAPIHTAPITNPAAPPRTNSTTARFHLELLATASRRFPGPTASFQPQPPRTCDAHHPIITAHVGTWRRLEISGSTVPAGYGHLSQRGSSGAMSWKLPPIQKQNRVTSAGKSNQAITLAGVNTRRPPASGPSQLPGFGE